MAEEMNLEDSLEFYEERAAIMEFDGGLHRLEAQRRAYFEWRKRVGPGVPVPDEIRRKAEEWKADEREAV